jgi:hypothetical protein
MVATRACAIIDDIGLAVTGRAYISPGLVSRSPDWAVGVVCLHLFDPWQRVTRSAAATWP